MQKRKTGELKTRIRLAGGEVDERTDEDVADAKKKAEESLENPLKNFPDDIRYLSVVACRQKIEISNRFKDRIAKEKVWDEFRMDACLGKHGDVAKRSSMNDVLWDRYLQHGNQLSLSDIKKMVMFDIKKRELYPPEYKGTAEDPPPEEYLKKLKAEGKLEGIYRSLDEITRL